jgi:hypothetical protein
MAVNYSGKKFYNINFRPMSNFDQMKLEKKRERNRWPIPTTSLSSKLVKRPNKLERLSPASLSGLGPML